jgi:hypothetical protein
MQMRTPAMLCSESAAAAKLCTVVLEEMCSSDVCIPEQLVDQLHLQVLEVHLAVHQTHAAAVALLLRAAALLLVLWPAHQSRVQDFRK